MSLRFNTRVLALAASLSQQKNHMHICGFYKDSIERLEMLAAYYKVGLDRDELCIFITNQKPADIIRGLRRYGLDIEKAVQTHKFQIYPIQSTYTPDRKFKSARMLSNLKDFVKKSESLGYTGVRGGGDMEWLADKMPGWENVGEYESRINRFIRTKNFTGICLFPNNFLNAELTQKIIQSHQYMIRNEILHANPYYLPPEKSFKLDVKVVAQIEIWLDKLDEQETRLAPLSSSV